MTSNLAIFERPIADTRMSRSIAPRLLDEGGPSLTVDGYSCVVHETVQVARIRFDPARSSGDGCGIVEIDRNVADIQVFFRDLQSHFHLAPCCGHRSRWCNLRRRVGVPPGYLIARYLLWQVRCSCEGAWKNRLPA